MPAFKFARCYGLCGGFGCMAATIVAGCFDKVTCHDTLTCDVPEAGAAGQAGALSRGGRPGRAESEGNDASIRGGGGSSVGHSAEGGGTTEDAGVRGEAGTLGASMPVGDAGDSGRLGSAGDYGRGRDDATDRNTGGVAGSGAESSGTRSTGGSAEDGQSHLGGTSGGETGGAETTDAAFGGSSGSSASDGGSLATGGTSAGGAGGDSPTYRQFTCNDSCFNSSCPGADEMCTVDFGRCEPVPCSRDADCCALSTCDDATYVCETSPYFQCTAGTCRRAEADYAGECRELTPEPDCSDPCPTAKPETGERCNVNRVTCAYGGADCYCGIVNGRVQWVCYGRNTCDSSCFNQTCPGIADMCTVDAGRYEPVPCDRDEDCCSLSLCDNLIERCDQHRSKTFMCSAGQCVRAADTYTGACKQIERLFPDDATCDDLCPASMPTNGTRCQVPDRDCTYGNSTCHCNSSVAEGILWECQ